MSAEHPAAQGQHGALSGPEPGEAQGEAAASRSCQGSLDGTAPAPGPESASAANTTVAETLQTAVGIERELLGSSAATVEQIVPTPRCKYCGHLNWTLERYGRLTHKCGCPERTDDFCQAHPQGCDDFTDIRNEAWRKSYQIMGSLPSSTVEVEA